jgi:hypothetical protein
MDGSESLEMRLSDEIWAEIEDAAWALPLRHREKYRRAVERELAEVEVLGPALARRIARHLAMTLKLDEAENA